MDNSITGSLNKSEKFVYIVEEGNGCSIAFDTKVNKFLEEGWEPVPESRIVKHTRYVDHQSMFLKRWE